MDWPKQVFIVYNGHPSSTSGQLFTALSQAIEEHTSCQVHNNPSPSLSLKGFASGLAANLSRLARLTKTEVLILHTYLIFSLPSLLLARLLGKRVIVFQWDVYPSTLKGRSLNQSKPRAFLDRLEARLSRLANTIIVPSADFVPFISHSDVRILPIWPSARQMSSATGKPGVVANRRQRSKSIDDAVWRLCFAGQMTALRGLEEAAEMLTVSCVQPFELHIYSSDPLPQKLFTEERFKVVHHGFVAPEELERKLAGMDFGLIALHPDMDQPAFPSKLFEFAGAGLPVLYTGPALPGFTDLLRDTGIGMDISTETTIDLAAIYENLGAENKDILTQLINRTKLTEQSLFSVLRSGLIANR